jgi:hypothetical protein
MYFDLWPTGESLLRTPMPVSDRLARFHRHVFLWVLQGWLAMFYIGAALAKLSQPGDILSHLLHWPALVDPTAVQMIGWLELALAVGMLTPMASWTMFRTVMRLSVAGLFGDAVLMGGYHAIQGHWSLAIINMVLMVFAVAVLVGRTVRTPPSGTPA